MLSKSQFQESMFKLMVIDQKCLSTGAKLNYSVIVGFSAVKGIECLGTGSITCTGKGLPDSTRVKSPACVGLMDVRQRNLFTVLH